MRRVAPVSAGIIILLLAGVLAAGCAADTPGAIATPPPPVTDLPTSIASPTATPTPPGVVGLLRLTAALDDPHHYCIDVPGHSDGVQLDAPLQAHTCKPGADDQLFELGHDGEYGELRMPAYAPDGGRCLAITDFADRPVALASCHGRDETLFSVAQLRNEGRLYVKTASLRKRCIGIAAGAGEPAGGRNHLRRDLTLYDCAVTDPALISWELAEQ